MHWLAFTVRGALIQPSFFVVQMMSNVGNAVFLKLLARYSKYSLCDEISEFCDHFTRTAKDRGWGDRAQL